MTYFSSVVLLYRSDWSFYLLFSVYIPHIYVSMICYLPLGQIAMSFCHTCSFPGQFIFLHSNATKMNETETEVLF